jgi:hypothetical protein
MNIKEYRYFTDNQWRKAADNQVFEVHEPYSGKLFARVAVRPHVFDSRREYLQGIRDGAENSCQHRQRKFTNRQRREIHAPMDGVRDSGWGRTGPRSLDDFSGLIWINSHSGQRQYPF